MRVCTLCAWTEDRQSRILYGMLTWGARTGDRVFRVRVIRMIRVIQVVRMIKGMMLTLSSWLCLPFRWLAPACAGGHAPIGAVWGFWG